MVYEKLKNIKEVPEDKISNVTGMLIDREILELEEIVEFLNNHEKLIERAQEALEVIEEDSSWKINKWKKITKI